MEPFKKRRRGKCDGHAANSEHTPLVVNLGGQGLPPAYIRHASGRSIRHASSRALFRNGAPLGPARPQKHFLWTIVGPDSSYSPLEIHICWKVLRDDRIDPPIHTEYLRSGGATTLIFMVDGAKAVISFVMRSPIPANMVVPPDKTTLA